MKGNQERNGHPAGMVQITKHLRQYLNQSAKDKSGVVDHHPFFELGSF
jgi:hypothetical protein